MAFQARRENRPTTAGLDGTVVILESGDGKARAEVSPANGFNCFRWLAERDGHMLDLLYADPQFFQGAKPTRSGVPILFPFPNRIRDGRFVWNGREYQLPLNDSTMKNAIHGFACRRPWRVVDEGGDGHCAWVTGEFRGSVDAPDCSHLWPADYQIRVTVRLGAASLEIAAVVSNPDRVPLPFGLGYHPYFRIPPGLNEAPEKLFIRASADRYWVLAESLPTGTTLPVAARLDLREPRRFRELELDDVLQNPGGPEKPGSLRWQGSVYAEEGKTELLRVEASPALRELVVFTPPHRQAICLEPYTCTTDAINLQQRGVDAGLIVLQPGEEWRGDVVLRLV
jgi:aldose 1-epimerase